MGRRAPRGHISALPRHAGTPARCAGVTARCAAAFPRRTFPPCFAPSDACAVRWSHRAIRWNRCAAPLGDPSAPRNDRSVPLNHRAVRCHQRKTAPHDPSKPLEICAGPLRSPYEPSSRVAEAMNHQTGEGSQTSARRKTTGARCVTGKCGLSVPADGGRQARCPAVIGDRWEKPWPQGAASLPLS